MPAIDDIKEALLNSFSEDDDFCGMFCNNCPEKINDPGDYYNPPEIFCPCDFDITDHRCCRKRDWSEIEELIERVGDIVSERRCGECMIKKCVPCRG